MTSDREFTRQLEQYLDDFEGPTPLPETVRNAVRAAVPRTKQAGSTPWPARYLSMTMSKAPIALAMAAAILVLAIGAYVTTRPNVGDDPTQPSPTAPSPAASPSASAEACGATTANRASRGTIRVRWCAHGPSEPDTVAFTMEGPGTWLDQYFPGIGTLWLRPAGGGAITFVLHADQTVADTLSGISGREGYAVDNRAPTSIGGLSGEVFDVSLADGASSDDAPPLITDPDLTWPIQEGTFTRVWLAQRGADTVMVATGAQLADSVGEALATLEWDE